MTIVIFSDGGSRGNPGSAATGVVIYKTHLGLESIDLPAIIDTIPLQTLSTFLGTTTNNVAEWAAVVEGLTWAQQHQPSEPVLSVLDSELVQRQIIGKYKIKDIKMKEYHRQFLAVKPASYSCIHVLREYNKHADQLVNETLDSQ